MQVKAKAKYIRMSPRKVRLVAGVIRGLDVELALQKLAVMDKRAVRPIVKLAKSAIASAEHNYELLKNNLFIEKIAVNDGPTYYRWMQKAFGRATPIRKRTSTVDIVLSEKAPSAIKKVAKKQSIKTATQEEVDGIVEKDSKKLKKDEFKDVKHSDLKKTNSKSLIRKVFPRKTGM